MTASLGGQDGKCAAQRRRNELRGEGQKTRRQAQLVGHPIEAREGRASLLILPILRHSYPIATPLVSQDIYCSNTANLLQAQDIYLEGTLLLIRIDQQRDRWLEGGFWGVRPPLIEEVVVLNQ